MHFCFQILNSRFENNYSEKGSSLSADFGNREQIIQQSHFVSMAQQGRDNEIYINLDDQLFKIAHNEFHSKRPVIFYNSLNVHPLLIWNNTLTLGQLTDSSNLKLVETYYASGINLIRYTCFGIYKDKSTITTKISETFEFGGIPI